MWPRLAALLQALIPVAKLLWPSIARWFRQRALQKFKSWKLSRDIASGKAPRGRTQNEFDTPNN